MLFTHSLQRACLVLLALLSFSRAESDAPMTPERADAIFAWFDQLPLPGLHGSKLVRVWTGERWENSKAESEPTTLLGFLTKENEKTFEVLTPDGDVRLYTKQGAEPSEPGFIGFRTLPLLEEARRFLPTVAASEKTADDRNRLYGFGFRAFDEDAEDLALARWCAKLGDKDLAVSLLNAIRDRQRSQPRPPWPHSVEALFQNSYGDILLEKAYGAFEMKKLRRPDLLASFQQIASLCPDADLTREREAIAVLEQMIREDATHPFLTEQQLAALPPVARAEELVLRLRDENRQLNPDPDLRQTPAAEIWPSNGSMHALEELGFAAAPALIKALDDDSFTREPDHRQIASDVYRVHDLAFKALTVIAGSTFPPPRFQDFGELHRTRFDRVREWWNGVQEKGEKNFLMERISAGDSSFGDFTHRLIEKYADEAIPFVIQRARTDNRRDRRVTLSTALWNLDDPHCREFFAAQALEGQELADRITAARGLQILHDGRGVSAMCAEWEKIIAAKGWSKRSETEPGFELYLATSVADFLAATDAPEAILILGEKAAILPADWRARLVCCLENGLRGTSDYSDGPPSEGTKKAFEDVLLGFLSDKAELPREFFHWNKFIGEGRICDLAAAALRELLPRKYEFDPMLSPRGRDRQCIAFANIRLKELGAPLTPLSPVVPKNAAVSDSGRLVCEVAVTAPLDKSEMGAKLAALRGSPLANDSVLAALLPFLAKEQKDVRGIVLRIARYRDLQGVSIRVNSMVGAFREADFAPNAFIACNVDVKDRLLDFSSTRADFQSWSDLRSWQPLREALNVVAGASPDTAFAICVYFETYRARPESDEVEPGGSR